VAAGAPTGPAAPDGPGADAGRPAASTAPAPASAASVPIHRGVQAWGLTGFFGLQSLAAYVIMGWLPSIYQDAGIAPARAGLLLALVVGIGAPISVVLPELAARRPDQRAWVVGLAAMAASAYLGLLLAPAAAPVVWAVLLGTGMGAFPLALVLIGLRALTNEGTAKLSALSQGVGYLIGASGPVVIGVLRDVTGSWRAPLVVLLVLLIPRSSAVSSLAERGTSTRPVAEGRRQRGHAPTSTAPSHRCRHPVLRGQVRTPSGGRRAAQRPKVVDIGLRAGRVRRPRRSARGGWTAAACAAPPRRGSRPS
jgi:hypothetical protein